MRVIGYARPYDPQGGRSFEAYFAFVGWDCVQLGFHICVSLPNIEIHIPFGFVRIGWRKDPHESEVSGWVVTR